MENIKEACIKASDENEAAAALARFLVEEKALGVVEKGDIKVYYVRVCVPSPKQ